MFDEVVHKIMDDGIPAKIAQEMARNRYDWMKSRGGSVPRYDFIDDAYNSLKERWDFTAG